MLGDKIYMVTWKDRVGEGWPICSTHLFEEPEDAVASLLEPEIYQGCLRCHNERHDEHAAPEDYEEFEKNLSGPQCLDCGNEMPKHDKGNICSLCHYERYDSRLADEADDE
mgnify:CR=1 FL=1